MRAKNPAAGETRLLLALAYYKSGAKGQARNLLLQIKPGTRGYDEAVLLLVKFYVLERDYPAAASLLRRAIAATTGDERLNFYLGLAAIYEENKQVDKAAAVFQTAIHRSASARIYLRYGMFLDRIGRQDAALTQMENALHLEPDNVMALNYVGYTWAERGIKLDQALRYIQKAVAGRPDDGFIRDSLGWVYFKLGRMKQAVAELKKASRDEADDPTIHEHLGDVYNAAHALKLSLESYRQSLHLFADRADKRRLRAKIRALQKKLDNEYGIWDDD
jgi:tetratricopeptide (TPR) repeat protein